MVTFGCGSIQRPQALRGRPTEYVEVRVSSPRPAELWSNEKICRAPCERTLPVGGATYEVRVPELPDSPSFEIPATDREVLVQVHPSHLELVGAGATLGAIGGGTLIAGAGAAALDLAGREDFQGALGPGLIAAASGAAILAGGIVCAALSGTSVTIKEIAETGGAIRF
jgi:hypothetical protein